jgi:hypothetical protein
MDKFVAQQKRAVGTVVNLALNIVADVVGHHNVQIRVNRIGDGGTDGRFVVFAQQQFDCAVGRAAVQRIVFAQRCLRVGIDHQHPESHICQNCSQRRCQRCFTRSPFCGNNCQNNHKNILFYQKHILLKALKAIAPYLS